MRFIFESSSGSVVIATSATCWVIGRLASGCSSIPLTRRRLWWNGPLHRA